MNGTYGAQQWDIGDPEPEDVTSVLDNSEDTDGCVQRWNKTNNGTGWKGYKDGKVYLDWPELARRWGPVRSIAEEETA